MAANYLRATNTRTQQKLNSAAHLKSTPVSVFTLNAFAVRAYLEGLDYSQMTYRECMDLLQELLELPQNVGIPLARQGDSTDENGYVEDFSAYVVEQMIAAGWDKEPAWKCRNSAAAKSAGGVKLTTRRLQEAYHATMKAVGDRSMDHDTIDETSSEALAEAMAGCE